MQIMLFTLNCTRSSFEVKRLREYDTQPEIKKEVIRFRTPTVSTACAVFCPEPCAFSLGENGLSTSLLIWLGACIKFWLNRGEVQCPECCH